MGGLAARPSRIGAAAVFGLTTTLKS